eukprot:4090286-Amphidinium_carterae.1
MIWGFGEQGGFGFPNFKPVRNPVSDGCLGCPVDISVSEPVRLGKEDLSRKTFNGKHNTMLRLPAYPEEPT